MRQVWDDLKSFVTVSMILILIGIVAAGLFGFTLPENLLILVTNLITAVFTYYFSKTKTEKENKEYIDNKED